MKRKSGTRKAAPANRRFLSLMAIMMLSAGSLHLWGLVDRAMATQANSEMQATPAAPVELLDALREREAAVAAREADLVGREKGVAEGLKHAKEELRKLEEAERRLAGLVKQIDTAAQRDIDQLTAVYSAMKPKDAAALFGEMSPDFAAGFLAVMPPDHAAAILAAVDPKTAYSFSVLLAGRNASLIAKANGQSPTN